MASPVHRVTVRGRSWWVKRDDLLRLARSGISGNKARKLMVINDKDGGGKKVWGSFGGFQSNAMVALSAVAQSQGAQLLYFTKDIPARLRKAPSGNYKSALDLGTNIVVLGREAFAEAFPANLVPAQTPPPPRELGLPADAYWIPQGGSAAEAEVHTHAIHTQYTRTHPPHTHTHTWTHIQVGLTTLADEIVDFWAQQEASPRPTVILPAGTGTTALFLARHLQPRGVDVAAVPCVGDAGYLAAQMSALDRVSGARRVFPRFLVEPPPGSHHRHHRFGAPLACEGAVWRELRGEGLPIDLVYAPHAWGTALDCLAAGTGEWCDSPLMYLHCGGLEGVETMLDRYRHLGIELEGEAPAGVERLGICGSTQCE